VITRRPDPAHPRISYLVFRLERHIRARLDETLARHGLSTTEYMVLTELRLRDGLSSAQLARIAFVTPQAMNLVILGLEQRELIHRRPDPAHRRVLSASLTPAARAVLLRCDKDVDGLEDAMLADLDDPARQGLQTALGACTHALQHLAGTAGSADGRAHGE
jgi:DNA-binding MarR family transcriptional regulator